MNADGFTNEELFSRLLQLEHRIEELEQENKRKDKKIDQLEEQLDQKDERIEEPETYLRKCENPHMHPSKRRSGIDESPTSQNNEDENVRTDGGTPGPKNGHDSECRVTADPDEEIEVTRDRCPECNKHFDESVGVEWPA